MDLLEGASPSSLYLSSEGMRILFKLAGFYGKAADETKDSFN